MSSKNWLESLNLATKYISPAYRFRDQLNAAIQLIQPHFESNYTVLLELSPSSINNRVLHFQRFLKVPATGLAKEYPIPRPLLKVNLSSKEMLNWLKKLTPVNLATPIPKDIRYYKLTFSQLKHLNANRVSNLLAKTLELTFEEMHIFPLLLKEQLWGLLCFCSPTNKVIPPEGYYCATIFGRTLADALAQQQYDMSETLKNEFLASANDKMLAAANDEVAATMKILPEEHLLTTIITNTVPGNIFLVDIKEGRAIFANTQKFLGYTITEKQNPLEIFVSIIHPDDMNVAVLDFIYQLKNASDNEVIKSEYRMQHKQGHWVWISERARVFKRFPDGVVHQYVSIMQDITKEREAEQTLLRQKAFLQATLSTLPDIKLRLNNKGKIIATFGTESELNELFDKTDTPKELTDFLPKFVVKGIEANMTKAKAQNELRTFEFFLSNEGDVSYYEARIAPLDGDEAILVLRDMTHLKKIQNDLRDQNSNLDHKNRLLEKYIESNLQLENFAYIASHDLREPLRTIRTFAQYLNRDIGDNLDSQSRANLDFVIGAANRMNHLIEDLLKYSTVNSDPMTNESIELPKLLNSILQGLQAVIEDQNAEIEQVDIPTQIYGNPARIQQLFQNLISNAVKFSKPDVPPKIVIRGKQNPDSWQFSVSDNGIGIDPEFHDRIFVIFKRLHTMDQYQGTGIGLALVKRIVNQHGGNIWVESESGKGTTFIFTILK